MSTSSNYPRSAHITVHLDAIAHNYQYMRKKAGSKAFAIVKADAYGHGSDGVASYLSNIADGFAVVSVGEGIGLRDAGITQPIIVLQGPQDDVDMDAIYENGLWPALHDEAQIAQVMAHRNAIDIEPWLKVDTGMGRLGVSLDSAMKHLRQNQLRWRGVLSHLASADDVENPFTAEQSARLEKVVKAQDLDVSLANSAGVLGWPVTTRQWARVGIGLYGSHPMIECSDKDNALKPAMSVHAPIVSIKRFKAGQGIGYGQTYRCTEEMLVAYAAIGYADGVPRVLDSSADVQIHGVRCPIIGRVSMDSIAIDCRGLPKAPALGDQILLWGPDQPVGRLAAAAGTISYELLTGIRGRRVYTDVHL